MGLGRCPRVICHGRVGSGCPLQSVVHSSGSSNVGRRDQVQCRVGSVAICRVVVELPSSCSLLD